MLQADIPHGQRALQAILLSQYRLKIFQKNAISIKPVVLFKSKTIDESNKFFEEFCERLKRLSVEDIERIETYNKGKNSVLAKMFHTIGTLVFLTKI